MRIILLALVLCLTTAPSAGAQAKTDDAFARAMFDPQFVLKHAQAIALTTTQRRAVLDELKTAQIALAPLQADMAEPAMELQELIEGTRIDEAKALAKIDRVLKLENEVKKAQAVFIIRVKNILTPEQQAKLRALRDADAREEGASREEPARTTARQPKPNVPPPLGP